MKRYLWLVFLSTATVVYAGDTWDKAKETLKDVVSSTLDYIPFGSTVKLKNRFNMIVRSGNMPIPNNYC